MPFQNANELRSIPAAINSKSHELNWLKLSLKLMSWIIVERYYVEEADVGVGGRRTGGHGRF